MRALCASARQPRRRTGHLYPVGLSEGESTQAGMNAQSPWCWAMGPGMLYDFDSGCSPAERKGEFAERVAQLIGKEDIQGHACA